MENEIFKYINHLFEYFGYWSIALIVSITLIMIPINYGIKKLISKTDKQALVRLGKISIQLMVFVISAICLILFSLIFGLPLNVLYILTNVFPCAFLAMALWGVIKVIRDLGVKPLLALILESNAVKKALKEIPIDNTIKKAIFDKLCELVENSDGDNAEVVISKETEIVKVIEEMIKGFTTDTSSVTKLFSNALKIKYQKEEK